MSPVALFVQRYNASEAGNVRTARLLFMWSVVLLAVYALCLLYLLGHALYFEWLFAPTTRVLDAL